MDRNDSALKAALELKLPAVAGTEYCDDIIDGIVSFFPEEVRRRCRIISVESGQIVAGKNDERKDTPGALLPHAGWRVEKTFSDSRFCAACHQFEADGPSLNGKPLENTFEEWRVSRYAKEGRTCQSCHMPDRRHLWRGIHDPEMVKSGLTIETSAAPANDRVRAELLIANTGVGHAFPTYVTPRVHVEIGQEDGRGRVIAATVERHLIARDVSLDLTEERADTRLMPDEKRRYAYDKPRAPEPPPSISASSSSRTHSMYRRNTLETDALRPIRPDDSFPACAAGPRRTRPCRPRNP